MISPTPSELRIIRLIITQNLGPDSLVLKQLPSLRFASRNMTGTGYFIEFCRLPTVLRVDDLNTAISTDLSTKLLQPQDLAGFTLFINNGFITSFEGYMFGDVAWPAAPLDEWLTFEPAETDAASMYETQRLPKHREKFTARGLNLLREPPDPRDIWALHV
jgi:hypothetical protein